VETTLQDLHRRIDGHAGLIAIDAQGNCYSSYTTPYMAYAGPASTISHLR
jgi:isoaspartyl peptidase/L-asparaginase-like protein (Ntn-hydrolase superfamily)